MDCYYDSHQVQILMPYCRDVAKEVRSMEKVPGRLLKDTAEGQNSLTFEVTYIINHNFMLLMQSKVQVHLQ